MTGEAIPDLDLFMMCSALNREALRPLPPGYFLRNCREEELGLWMAFHFDDPADAEKHAPYMRDYFESVYAAKREEFFRRCLFVCDSADEPVATCFLWRAYDAINTLHWLKVRRDCEDRGIGRALLSHIMAELPEAEYPVFLHTHPSCYRAVKLYTDFGFVLLADPVIGTRENGLGESLPILKKYMPEDAFSALRTASAPRFFIEAAASSPVNAF